MNADPTGPPQAPPPVNREVYLREFIDTLLLLSKEDAESFDQVLFLLERAWDAQKRLWQIRDSAEPATSFSSASCKDTNLVQPVSLPQG